MLEPRCDRFGEPGARVRRSDGSAPGESADLAPRISTSAVGLAARGAICAASLALAGCAAVLPRGITGAAPVPDAPNLAVSLPARPQPPPVAAPLLPEALVSPDATITLAQVVDIALKRNPLTRASYAQARSAAAELGSKRAAYYPTVDGSASFERTNRISSEPSARATLDIYGPEVALNYLLWDMGGRAANAEDARLGVLAAGFSHNATIRDVVLRVVTTYVRYLDAKARLEAETSNVKTFESALDAATRRHDVGVATIAEVLQARTALSQAQLALDRVQGEVQIIRGSLATAMGLPANTPYDVGTLPAEVPLERTTAAIDELIVEAKTLRPDLAAAQTLADKASIHVDAVNAEGKPSVSLYASGGRAYYDPASFGSPRDTWSAQVLLTVPLFTGFAHTYDVEKAKEDAEAAKAESENLEQQIILQVWTSYYGFSTAARLVATTRDLLASAEESERVALGRYKQGVGTILDLLAAQSALAGARAQSIQARSLWFGALAQLTHDVGLATPLDLASPAGRESSGQ